MTVSVAASDWRHQRAMANAPAIDPERRGRFRVVLAMLGFAVLYATLAGRLLVLGVSSHDFEEDSATFIRAASKARPDIIDRNGETLATDIRTASLFAEPRYVIDPDDATEKLASVLPDLDRVHIRQLLSTEAKFAYIRRRLRRASSRRSTSSVSPASGSAWRTDASIPEVPPLRTCSGPSTSTTRASPGSRSTSTNPS
jgi:cell division protein FtsI (penicillin-binding protein 3)